MTSVLSAVRGSRWREGRVLTNTRVLGRPPSARSCGGWTTSRRMTTPELALPDAMAQLAKFWSGEPYMDMGMLIFFVRFGLERPPSKAHATRFNEWYEADAARL